MAKTIMLQGSMSNVGKSVLTAALCRIFMRDGYRAAPFKSQNMALNSYVTREGLEIGRAQTMQAQAAGLEPSVLMNPILLKPTSDEGSQVILNGKVYGNMSAREFFSKKREFIPAILEAFEKLSNSNDIIVIEGAGSPAELNLKSDDIVNMGLAKLVNSPVMLVGDIDRGGIFAQLLGTFSLLENDERSLIKGFVVNKFRGNRDVFSDGIKILEERSGIPVAGVVPYLNVKMEDEDSLSERLENRAAKGIIDICAVRLPRISNYTDLDVFEQYDGVSVRYISNIHELGEPDLIVIPGTKNTISDMIFLRESGLEAAIKKLSASGTPVFGICGGYQILCEEIFDPNNSEGGGNIRGMGLLKGRTVFSGEKKTTLTEGEILKTNGIFSELSGKKFSGYEIHMGVTNTSEKPFLSVGGAQKNNVYGCYIHGFFDSAEISETIIKSLFEKRNIPFDQRALSHAEFRESQFDILEKSVRESLNMKLVYKILNDGI